MCVGIHYIYSHQVYNICNYIWARGVYVCVYVCIYIYTFVRHAHVCVYVYYACTCWRVHTLISRCVGIYHIYTHHVYNICYCIWACRVYVCVHVCVCTFTHVHATCTCVYVCSHTCMQSLQVFVCACLHVHTLLHMCMYVFTYTNAEFACVRVHSYTWMGMYVSYGCVLIVHRYVYI